MENTERVDFHDHGTDSAAFLILRPEEATVALGLGIEADGDLDLVVTHADARKLAEAILRAVGDRT